MTDQADTARGEPRVMLAQRVVDKIVRGGLLYPEMETGEAMVGLVVPNAARQEPDIYILDTLGAGEHAVREWGMFELGGEWQGDAFHWLHVNWEAFREVRRPSYGRALAAKWDHPLNYVGDWHKQPGAMTAPSSGDLHQARKIIQDRAAPEQQLVAPIVTLYPLAPPAETLARMPRADEVTPGPNGESAPPAAADSATPQAAAETPPLPEAAVEIAPAPGTQNAERAILRPLAEAGVLVRIDFWYMSRRTRGFIRVQPTVLPDDQLPRLPPLSWHLARTRRFDQEHKLLLEAGYTVDVVRWDADGMPPFEIVFAVYKPGSRHVILLVTSTDYPSEMPAVRVAPLVSAAEDEDLFEKIYAASRPVLMPDLPNWAWDSKRTLIELVWHVEKSLPKETPA